MNHPKPSHFDDNIAAIDFTFKRFLVQSPHDPTRRTSISMRSDEYAVALRLSDNNASLVSAVIKQAALQVRPVAGETFSETVRDKAFKKLRGMCKPAKKADSANPCSTDDELARLAAENNAQWEGK